MNAEERFWAKVEKTEGCWIWRAATRKGYGRFKSDGAYAQAHRFAYELLVGPIPSGFVLDHLCRNRGCVNPDHLEPVTNRENILRGVGASARNAAKTHCVHGHPLTDENLYRTLDGNRECLTCKRSRNREAERRSRRARGIEPRRFRNRVAA